MQKDKVLSSYWHLHFIVFVWGFTAVIGALISLQALSLVWYRMLFASIFIGLYFIIKKTPIQLPIKTIATLAFGGLVITLHWCTFFEAIKVANVSVTLACMSVGAFFTSLLEPIFYKRKIIIYEVLFGMVVIVGLYLIFDVEKSYKQGIVLALISAFLSALFSIINGKLAQKHPAAIISFYELASGVLFLTLYLAYQQYFTFAFFSLSTHDIFWLIILSTFCTAYAFIASVQVMKYLSPYTVMLTINLEPVYGIILALMVFKDKEKMSFLFYLGAFIIILTVILNGILKNRNK